MVDFQKTHFPTDEEDVQSLHSGGRGWRELSEVVGWSPLKKSGHGRVGVEGQGF